MILSYCKKIKQTCQKNWFQFLKNYIPSIEYDYNNSCVRIYSRSINNLINYVIEIKANKYIDSYHKDIEKMGFKLVNKLYVLNVK